MAKQTAKEGETRQLPGSYSEMYPARFLKADLLKGRKVTLTIKNIVGEGLMSEDGKANLEWVVSFAERPLEFVMNKTNATCLYRMFGGDPNSWIGRKVTLFPTTVMAFGARQDCIRIWGSPELSEDLPITVPQGRKKALEMVMHKVTFNGATNGTPKPATGLDPRITAAFEILDLSLDERADYLAAHAASTPAQILADLNLKIDHMNAQEQA
jgi:hypothetical protein